MHDESQKSITQIRDIIEDEKKRRTVPSKVKYIRIKEATEIFQIKKTKSFLNGKRCRSCLQNQWGITD